MMWGDDSGKYYRETLAQKMIPIERQFKVEMQQAQGINARRGVSSSRIQNGEIAKIIVERWRRIVEARIDSCLETCDLFDIRFKTVHVEPFVSEFESARSSVIACYLNYSDDKGVATTLVEGFDEVNRLARKRLQFEVRKAERKRIKDKSKRSRKKGEKENKVYINAPVTGGVQIGGANNTQTVSIDLKKEE